MIAGAPVTAELTQQLLERLPNTELGQGYGEYLCFLRIIEFSTLVFIRDDRNMCRREHGKFLIDPP